MTPSNYLIQAKGMWKLTRHLKVFNGTWHFDMTSCLAKCNRGQYITETDGVFFSEGEIKCTAVLLKFLPLLTSLWHRIIRNYWFCQWNELWSQAWTLNNTYLNMLVANFLLFFPLCLIILGEHQTWEPDKVLHPAIPETTSWTVSFSFCITIQNVTSLTQLQPYIKLPIT